MALVVFLVLGILNLTHDTHTWWSKLSVCHKNASMHCSQGCVVGPTPLLQATHQASLTDSDTRGLPATAQNVMTRFQNVADNPKERVRLLLDAAHSLTPLPDSQRTAENRVMGCTAQVRDLRAANTEPEDVPGVPDPTTWSQHGRCSTCWYNSVMCQTGAQSLGVSLEPHNLSLHDVTPCR